MLICTLRTTDILTSALCLSDLAPALQAPTTACQSCLLYLMSVSTGPVLQISGGQKYRPPCVDVNAPDLYIPLMAVWSYAMVACVIKAVHHSFKPDYFYSIVSSSTACCIMQPLPACA